MPAADAAFHRPGALPGTIHQGWLVFDAWNELRAYGAMFFDRRYFYRLDDPVDDDPSGAA